MQGDDQIVGPAFVVANFSSRYIRESKLWQAALLVLTQFLKFALALDSLHSEGQGDLVSPIKWEEPGHANAEVQFSVQSGFGTPHEPATTP